MTEIIWEELRDAALEEGYFRCKHPSGLEIQVLTKPGYSTSYALFSAKYGSIDTAILSHGGARELPEGTAHFLEHKLFESEDLDAFARFAQTGASANAFTSFERTAYLFSCAAHFDKNLAILLDFVQSPYFTQATVEKEQGIIGQEIRMYQDNPGWEVMFRLLRLLYRRHPVRVDIAGTEESISEITAELLHECYRNFYNLHNMVLCVAGDVAKEAVLQAANALLKPTGGEPAKRRRMPDPEAPAQTYTERRMPVAVPRFMLGWKEALEQPELSEEETVLADLILDALTGECSALYEQLLGQGLINTGFDCEFFSGYDYACSLFGGESKQPKQAAALVEQTLLEASAKGLDAEDFECARKKAYGRLVMEYNDIEDLALRMTDAYFAGNDLFARARALRDVTLEQANGRLRRMFRPGWTALSVILPLEEE
ncbi:MAG: insulinase family protein [Oscillospiraceae bacterium]|jgi:predicted Zn-dependent peptidase|nr:insulinase family protein [Oscillospiraceae bacterium]